MTLWEGKSRSPTNFDPVLADSPKTVIRDKCVWSAVNGIPQTVIRYEWTPAAHGPRLADVHTPWPAISGAIDQ